jgi:phage terminase large subunit-like protein
MCIVNSVVTQNPAGDRKLDKSKRTGRIDGAVALAMAFGITPQQPAQRKSYIEDRGVLFT